MVFSTSLGLEDGGQGPDLNEQCRLGGKLYSLLFLVHVF